MVQVAVSKDRIAAFCRKWQVATLSLFGSALRGDFGPDSDVDVLVSFLPEAAPTLFDLARMQDELKTIFGREVDLVTRSGLESSRNYLRRRGILDSAVVVYGP